LLNVIAQMDSGAAPSSISQAMRATSVVVLPDPAGATHSTGPGGATAARRWSGASRASRSTTDGCPATAGVSPEALIRRSRPALAGTYGSRQVGWSPAHRHRTRTALAVANLDPRTDAGGITLVRTDPVLATGFGGALLTPCTRA
jgi:hypothetical protein